MRRGGELRGWLGGLMLACCVAVSAVAQDAAAGGAGESAAAPLPVLHVYTDLLQIPVLVLDHSRERLAKPTAASRFSLSLAGGPWFHPMHVRQEGEDPVSMSILLDMSGWTGQMMPKVNEALASLGTGVLHPQDTVAVYALDCQLSTVEGRIAPEAAALKSAANELMAAVTARRAAPGGCRHGGHLWDALLALTMGMRELPGRRVIVAVSDGEDSGSQHKWREVTEQAQASSVTVFGESYRPPAAVPSAGWGGPNMGRGEAMEDPFQSVCGLSGGVARVMREPTLGADLGWIVAALRERYIVEFPRPANSTPGRHDMVVRVENGQDLYIRSAGLMYPGRSDAETNDPNTIKGDPSRLPTQGNRRSMTP